MNNKQTLEFNNFKLAYDHNLRSHTMDKLNFSKIKHFIMANAYITVEQFRKLVGLDLNNAFTVPLNLDVLDGFGWTRFIDMRDTNWGAMPSVKGTIIYDGFHGKMIITEPFDLSSSTIESDMDMTQYTDKHVKQFYQNFSNIVYGNATQKTHIIGLTELIKVLKAKRFITIKELSDITCDTRLLDKLPFEFTELFGWFTEDADEPFGGENTISVLIDMNTYCIGKPQLLALGHIKQKEKENMNKKEKLVSHLNNLIDTEDISAIRTVQLTPERGAKTVQFADDDYEYIVKRVTKVKRVPLKSIQIYKEYGVEPNSTEFERRSGEKYTSVYKITKEMSIAAFTRLFPREKFSYKNRTQILDELSIWCDDENQRTFLIYVGKNKHNEDVLSLMVVKPGNDNFWDGKTAIEKKEQK